MTWLPFYYDRTPIAINYDPTMIILWSYYNSRGLVLQVSIPLPVLRYHYYCTMIPPRMQGLRWHYDYTIILLRLLSPAADIFCLDYDGTTLLLFYYDSRSRTATIYFCQYYDFTTILLRLYWDDTTTLLRWYHDRTTIALLSAIPPLLWVGALTHYAWQLCWCTNTERNSPPWRRVGAELSF